LAKIAINCRVLNKRHGGPKRFLSNTLQSLIQIDKKNNYYLLLDRDYNFETALPDNFRKIVFNTKNKFLFEYIYVPVYSYKMNFDIYYVSDPVFSPLVKANKKITVFHDIIYFEKNQKREFNFIQNLHHKTMIPLSSKFSSVNLCVSKFTESRVHNLLGITNTSVIYEGIEDKFRVISNTHKIDEVIKKYNLKLPFIFYIGSLSPRKNTVGIIKAFDSIKNDVPHNLYLFGGYSWKDKEVIELLDRPSATNRIFRGGFVEEEDLPVIYNLADAFLYPSFYEGFGLPILEAQACGCPVITSNVSSMPEVAGEGAILVDPYSIEEIANAISKIIKDTHLRDNLIQKGFANCKLFSWEKCAEETVRVFGEVYNEG
jgi:glycosyltransferase involved in cell wall biosynthesis